MFLSLWTNRKVKNLSVYSVYSVIRPLKYPGVSQKGFPCSSVGKESAYHTGDLGSIPRSGRSPGEGKGNPLQYSCLENPMDRGAWQATVHGVARVGHDLGTKSPPPPPPSIGNNKTWFRKMKEVNNLSDLTCSNIGRFSSVKTSIKKTIYGFSAIPLIILVGFLGMSEWNMCACESVYMQSWQANSNIYLEI